MSLCKSGAAATTNDISKDDSKSYSVKIPRGLRILLNDITKEVILATFYNFRKEFDLRFHFRFWRTKLSN